MLSSVHPLTFSSSSISSSSSSSSCLLSTVDHPCCCVSLKMHGSHIEHLALTRVMSCSHQLHHYLQGIAKLEGMYNGRFQ